MNLQNIFFEKMYVHPALVCIRIDAMTTFSTTPRLHILRQIKIKITLV